MTAEREGVAERWVAVLERMRERQADCLLMAQGTAESEPIRERIEALEAAIRALRQGGGWLPIESVPKDAVCIFWVAPKAAEETYLDTDGNPILARIQPYARQCKFGEWGSLMKATHWQPVQDISAPPSPAKEG